jgi:hypothetical protein
MVNRFVIYLFWAPLGAEPLERFASSYLSHPAGLEHQLIFLHKQLEDSAVTRRCRSLADQLGAEGLQAPATGLDLDAYFAAARRLQDAGTLCFLNTSSEILADDWLAALGAALKRPGTGLVGTTGSYESVIFSAPRPLRPLLRGRHPGFPNPHVRTTGFMLERDLMLTLDWPPSLRKQTALALENGTPSITRQIAKRGLRTLIVGRDGYAYEPARWPESRTFRSGSQENLLIADNRTREYAEASPSRRAQLTRLAWGDQVS